MLRFLPRPDEGSTAIAEQDDYLMPTHLVNQQFAQSHMSIGPPIEGAGLNGAESRLAEVIENAPGLGLPYLHWHVLEEFSP